MTRAWGRDRPDCAAGSTRYSRRVAEPNWEGMPKKEGRGWRVYVLGVAILVLLIVIIQNSQTVPVDILFVETEMPLIIALVLAGALGALIGWALPHVRRSRRVEREQLEARRQ
jgi:uncharacterized integral membrane protein